MCLKLNLLRFAPAPRPISENCQNNHDNEHHKRHNDRKLDQRQEKTNHDDKLIDQNHHQDDEREYAAEPTKEPEKYSHNSFLTHEYDSFGSLHSLRSNGSGRSSCFGACALSPALNPGLGAPVATTDRGGLLESKRITLSDDLRRRT